MLSHLRLTLPAAICLSVVCLVFAGPLSVHAGITTYYQEDFTGQEGLGITSPGTYSNASWSVNGTNAPQGAGYAQVTPVPDERMEFYELAGPGNGGGPGTVIFETAAVAISVSNPAYLSYLTMTLDATLAGVSGDDGDFLRIESVINGNVVETTTFASNTAELVTHDLAPHILLPNTQYNYILRVTATQLADNAVTSSFTIDNILVEGLSVPEPASMSLLGMGVAAMVTAGYRRRQKVTAELVG